MEYFVVLYALIHICERLAKLVASHRETHVAAQTVVGVDCEASPADLLRVIHGSVSARVRVERQVELVASRIGSQGDDTHTGHSGRLRR